METKCFAVLGLDFKAPGCANACHIMQVRAIAFASVVSLTCSSPTGLKVCSYGFCTMACKSLLTANGLVRLQVMIVLQQGLYLLPHHNSTDAFASNDFLQHGLRVFVHYKRSFVFARNGFLRQGLHLLARKYKITRRRLVDSRTLPQSYQQHDF